MFEEGCDEAIEDLSLPVTVAEFVLTEIVYIVLLEVNEEGTIFVS